MCACPWAINACGLSTLCVLKEIKYILVFMSENIGILSTPDGNGASIEVSKDKIVFDNTDIYFKHHPCGIKINGNSYEIRTNMYTTGTSSALVIRTDKETNEKGYIYI